MKFFTAIILTALLAPSAAMAEGAQASPKSPVQKNGLPEWPVVEVVRSDAWTGPKPTIYSIKTRLLKDGVSVYQAKLQAVAGTPAAMGEYSAAPTSEGVRLNDETFETGYIQMVNCAGYGAPGSGKIQCHLIGEVRDFVPPQTGPKASLPEVQSRAWDQTVVVGNGETAVVTMGKYQYEMTAQAL